MPLTRFLMLIATVLAAAAVTVAVALSVGGNAVPGPRTFSALMAIGAALALIVLVARRRF